MKYRQFSMIKTNNGRRYLKTDGENSFLVLISLKKLSDIFNEFCIFLDQSKIVDNIFNCKHHDVNETMHFDELKNKSSAFFSFKNLSFFLYIEDLEDLG